MPDISGFQALDVAIGLAFLYFVFSLLASGVNEGIASVFALRARFLERGMNAWSGYPDTREICAVGGYSVSVRMGYPRNTHGARCGACCHPNNGRMTWTATTRTR